MTTRRVPFLSLVPGEDAADVWAAIERVVARGWFILGPEVEAFEAEFAAISGAKYAIGVGTGTDAIALTLRALGIGAGDEVITTPLSAAYSALAIMMAGARPVFADIDPARMTLDPDHVESAISARTRAILPVHLYGQPAAMQAIETVATRHNLAIVEDCCQAHLATESGRAVGTIGVAGAFSFYPTKNLGALGDGGAVVTNDPVLAVRIRRLRNGGQVDRYRHEEFGVNSRLDDLQAAVLRARLAWLPTWTARRRSLAARYRASLVRGQTPDKSNSICLGSDPLHIPDTGHVYHLFVIRSTARQELQAHLAARGIETLIHYPVPISRQPAMQPMSPARCPIAEQVCGEVLSLPLYPALRDDDVDYIAAALTGHDACVR